MTDEQIRLYAACRVACPSPMIRLRSTTDKHRLIVIATRQPFNMAPPGYPRVLPAPSSPTERDLRYHGPEIEHFEGERVWIAVNRFTFMDYGPVAYKLVAEELATSILRSFRRADLNVRL